MATPDFLRPFVVSTAASSPTRLGNLDVYRPESTDRRRPAIVFVHGGPLPADLRPTPRDWPVYVGYGSLAAASNVVGVTVDHRLHSPSDYPQAADDIALAVMRVRHLNGVDPARIALWFFSGGGLLMAEWLAEPPRWLRCVAASYPVLAPLPGRDIDPRFRPADALPADSDLPLLVTRVGKERDEVATTVETFFAEAARRSARLDVLDVPRGRHGFDMLDHTNASRNAVTQAMSWVVAALTA